MTYHTELSLELLFGETRNTILSPGEISSPMKVAKIRCTKSLVVVSAQSAHLESHVLSAQLKFGERQQVFEC